MKNVILFLMGSLLLGLSEIHAQCNALHFDGVDDYVQAASPFTGDSDFTVEMWFKAESTSTGTCTNSNISNFRWLISWDDNQFGIGDCNGDLRFVFFPLCPVGGTGLCTDLPAVPIHDNNWHHVAYTKTAITTRIYVDGNFLINFAATPYDLSGFFRLGRSGSGNVGKNWQGPIDEVRIWNVARTQAEIQAAKDCQLAGNEPGLVGYYRADQGIAGGNNPSVNMLDDLTAGNHDGALSNFALATATSNWVTGASGLSCTPCPTSTGCSALHFDGTDDYVQAASPFTGDSDFTVEMWFKAESTSTGTCTSANISNFRWLIAWDDNQFGIGDCNGDLRFVFLPLCPVGGTGLCTSLPAFPIHDNNWHHVAYTKTAISTRIYIDGVFFVNFAATPYDLSGFFRLGRSGTGNVGKNWQGAIDEVRIWNVARTEIQIQGVKDCQLAGNEPGLVAYYRADEGVPAANNSSLTLLDDLTAGNHDSTLNNFARTGTSSNWITGAPAVACVNCTTIATGEPAFFQYLSMFPNPAGDVVNFEWKGDAAGQDNFAIGIFDTNGKQIQAVIFSNDYPRTSINVGALPPGLYFVKVADRSGAGGVKKLVRL